MEEDTCFDDIVKKLVVNSRVCNSTTDPEKEKLINEIIEWDFSLTKLQKKGYRPRYKVYDYRSENLYNFDNHLLKKILRNIAYRIHDILSQTGFRLEAHTKYRSKKYKLKPAFAKYWISKIAPVRLGQKLFPPFLSEVTLDELDMEYLYFIGENLSNLCKLDLLKLEWLIENGKRKESDVIKTIRRDITRRPGVTAELKREVEDELFRYELSHKTPKQQEEMKKLYDLYVRVTKQKQEEEERQQQQLLSDGLKRRKRLEQLKKPFKQLKKEEQLGKSAAEAIIEFHRKKKKEFR